MSFLAPVFLWLGAGSAAAVVALHFIVTHQPRSEAFPTARFVPQSPVQAVSNATRPTDLFLLLLRVLAFLCAAAAMAKPVFTSGRAPLARIIIADISTASRQPDDVRDSAKKYFRKGDILVALDSRPRFVGEPDSLPQKSQSLEGPNLSAGLIAAIRSAAVLRDRADSIALILVSSLPLSAWDAATDTIRSLWPGAVQIVRVAPIADTIPPKGATVKGNWVDDDPLRYSVDLAVKRGRPSSAQVIKSGIASESAANAIIHWPRTERPRFSRAAAVKLYTAFVVDDVVVVAPFKTAWEFPPDSLNGAKVVARWSDGTPAAIQRATPAGCILSVNIPVPVRGDLVIRPEFVGAVGQLLLACKVTPASGLLADSLTARLQGGAAAASRNAFQARPAQRSPFTAWLLFAATLLLVAELFARRSLRVPANRQEREIPRAAA